MMNDLERIKKYCEKATKGPWDRCWRKVHDGQSTEDFVASDIEYDFPTFKNCKKICSFVFRPPDKFNSKNNMEFIAQARTDIPELAQELELTRKVVEATKKVMILAGTEAEELRIALKELEKYNGKP